MGRTCGTYEKQEKYVLILVSNTEEKKSLEVLRHRWEYNIKTGVKEIGLKVVDWVNLLKPTGHVMHQHFNIKKFYVLPTLYLSVLYLSENKQRLVPLTA